MMNRMLIKLGFHGKAHNKATRRLIESMHNNGLGA